MELWQRFSPELRDAVLSAHRNAVARADTHITTEDLLSGMLGVEDCSGVRILRHLQVTPQAVLEALQAQPQEEAGGPAAAEVTFTEEAQRVVQEAYYAAHTAGEELIGTEYLLLGIVARSGGLAGQLLNERGVNVETVRKRIVSDSE